MIKLMQFSSRAKRERFHGYYRYRLTSTLRKAPRLDQNSCVTISRQKLIQGLITWTIQLF